MEKIAESCDFVSHNYFEDSRMPMITKAWKEVSGSVCSIVYEKNGTYVSGGTGFKLGDKVITNNHVIDVPDATIAKIRFVKTDGNTTILEKSYPVDILNKHLLSGSGEKEWDYAIFDLDDFKSIPGLEFSKKMNIEIGLQVASFGFHFGSQNLTINTGFVSSRYQKNGIKILQLDLNVNSGNSGGPLIDLQENKVIGIVTRKGTGLSESFNELIKSFTNNAATLQKAKFMINMGGIDIGQALSVTQKQMAGIAKQIERSSNVGIGYAFELEGIKRDIPD